MMIYKIKFKKPRKTDKERCNLKKNIAALETVKRSHFRVKVPEKRP